MSMDVENSALLQTEQNITIVWRLNGGYRVPKLCEALCLPSWSFAGSLHMTLKD